MKLKTMIVAGMLSIGLLSGLTAHAEERKPGMGPGQGMSHEEREKRCQANPEKCAEMKAKMKERQAMRETCKDDPAKCEQMRKEHHEKKFQERCEKNPQKCEEMKSRREEFKKKCEADPKACEARKAEIKERVGERREQRKEGGPK